MDFWAFEAGADVVAGTVFVVADLTGAAFFGTAVFSGVAVFGVAVFGVAFFFDTEAWTPVVFDADFLVGAFLGAGFFAGVFLTAVFLAAALLAGEFLVAVFLVAVFFGAAFFAAGFLVAVFFVAVFFGAVFLVAVFLVAVFFAVSFLVTGEVLVSTLPEEDVVAERRFIDFFAASVNAAMAARVERLVPAAFVLVRFAGRAPAMEIPF